MSPFSPSTPEPHPGLLLGSSLHGTVYITANSPGEVAGFLSPMVAAFREVLPEARLAVLLLPCTFATGQEEEVVRSLPGVSDVYPSSGIFRLLQGPPPHPPLALLHLGGDLAYAARLARRWQVPAWAYQWAHRRWDKALQGYFVKTSVDEQRLLGQGIAPNKIYVVGDLIVDAVQAALARAAATQAGGSPSIASPHVDQAHAGPAPGDSAGFPHLVFLTGSRLHEVRYLASFYLEVAERVHHAYPQAQASLLISPFLETQALRRVLALPPDAKFGGVAGELEEPQENTWTLRSPQGTQLSLVRSHPLAVMAKADLVVSIPGTKTGEAGALARPTLMILPCNRPEEVPYIGIIGLLDWIPGVGKHLKGWLLRTLVQKRLGLLAQPNILAGEEVVPELRGILRPADVARRVLELLAETAPEPSSPGSSVPRRDSHHEAQSEHSPPVLPPQLAAMSARLKALYTPFQGASLRMARIVAGGVANTAAFPAEGADQGHNKPAEKVTPS